MSQYDDQLTPVPAEKRKRGVVLATVGVLVAGTLGAGAWAATQFLGGGGPQPASALPANTLVVATLDLDPSLGLKVAARDFIGKFPGLKGGGGGSGDVRETVWNWLDLGCGQKVDFDDIEPWLGDRAAIAAVPRGKRIETVVVVEVTDQEKARAGVTALGKCLGHEDSEHPDEPESAFVGDYLVATDAKGFAAEVAASARKAALADSPAYRDSVDRAGGAGVLTAYLAKEGPARFIDQMMRIEEEFEEEIHVEAETELEAEPELEEAIENLASCRRDETRCKDLVSAEFCEDEQECIAMFGPKSSRAEGEPGVEGSDDAEAPFGSCASEKECQEMELDDEFEDVDEDEWLEQVRAPYKDFQGAAATLRFEDGDLVGHVATKGLKGSGMFTPLPLSDGNRPAAAGVLPQDAGAVLSSGLAPGWPRNSFAALLGFTTPPGTMMAGPEDKLVKDVEAMFGDSASIVLGRDVDPSKLAPRAMAKAEVGLRIVGDPGKVAPLLRTYAGKERDLKGLHIVKGDGVVAAGFNEAYVGRLAGAGTLGDVDRFRDAVPDEEGASTVMYADLASPVGLGILAEMFDERADRLEALDTFGYSEKKDDDGYLHARLLIRTD